MGLRLFEHRSFEEIRTSVVPWLETFCDPVETEADGELAFRVREPAVLGLHALKTTEAGKVFSRRTTAYRQTTRTTPTSRCRQFRASYSPSAVPGR
ncbi:hypothetical protein [Streptomyces sp. Amel2xC10]|uniref:hypothetical protein n=1 Tax=Streptomyces sp. Amel2xC10 TaxID=1305826 RepID=UPI0035630C9B